MVISLLLIFGSLAYAYGGVEMSVTVGGWFNTRQIDSTNLAVSTNMVVWVNGTQFVTCSENKNLVRSDYYQYQSY
jgi:hypothetical protein